MCKLTHALSQSAATYLKAVEVGEFEARLEALEKAQATLQDAPAQWWAVGGVRLKRRLNRLSRLHRGRTGGGPIEVWLFDLGGKTATAPDGERVSVAEAGRRHQGAALVIDLRLKP